MRSVEAEGGDRELVGDFVERADEAAFRGLYRKHTPALLGLAERLAGGRGREAEDVVQEAWLRAAASLGSFRWSSSLRTWLSGFVVNVCRERWRSSRRDTLPSGEGVAEPADPSPFAPVERIDLERAVAELPGGFRAVIVLHDVEGLTHEEIAECLGIEPGTSKSQLARARRALRARLAGRPSTAMRRTS
jgi:RNA polymerase sigma-70 factor (ECF subfamily)